MLLASLNKCKLRSDLQQLPLNKTVPSSAVDLDELPICKLEPYPVEKPQ